ncbi:MAG: hypothetical protein ACERKX_09770 [Anaerolineales bacterium]
MPRRKEQAFKQAPWRTKVSMTGRTVLPLIAMLVVGGMYLAVNSRLAKTGQRVLILQNEIAELQRRNAELTATLASLTTPDLMWERALELGFHPATKEEVEYIIIENYIPPETFVAPLPPSSGETHRSGLSPAYTETLGDWLSRWLGLGSA